MSKITERARYIVLMLVEVFRYPLHYSIYDPEKRSFVRSRSRY